MKCIYFIFLRRSFTLIFSQSDIDLLNNFTDLCVQLFFFLFLTLCLSYGMAWHWLDSLLLNSQFYYIIKRDEEFFMIEIENMCKQFVLRLLMEEENEIQMFNWYGHFVLLAQLGFCGCWLHLYGVMWTFFFSKFDYRDFLKTVLN